MSYSVSMIRLEEDGRELPCSRGAKNRGLPGDSTFGMGSDPTATARIGSQGGSNLDRLCRLAERPHAGCAAAVHTAEDSGDGAPRGIARPYRQPAGGRAVEFFNQPARPAGHWQHLNGEYECLSDQPASASHVQQIAQAVASRRA